MKYFKLESEMSYYNDMMKDPEYFKKAKGKKFKIVYMSPDQYIKEVACQQKTSPGYQYEIIMDSKLERLRDYIKSGNKMHMLTIESTKHLNIQEGRHRAILAKELGVKKVPVIVVIDMEKTEWKNYMKKNHPDIWKWRTQ